MKQTNCNRRCPKYHFPICKIDGSVFYARTSCSSSIALNNSPTLRKIRNLILLFIITEKNKIDHPLIECINYIYFNDSIDYMGSYDEKEYWDADWFCRIRTISKSTFLRLNAIVTKFIELNKAPDEIISCKQPIRQYLTILALLNYLLKDCGITMQDFCDQFQISRRTFFRYVSKIENTLIYENLCEIAISFGDAGTYRLL